MPGPKRTKAQREYDLMFIAEQYRLGTPQHRIVELLAQDRDYTVSQPTVSNDLKELRKRWRDRASDSMEAFIAEELSKIDALEVTYREAWIRSLEEKETTTTGRETRTAGGVQKATVKREQLLGDPRFLEGIQWCINRRLKLRGADEPDRLNLNFDGPQVFVVNGQEFKF